jgi:hypothetical protein
MKTRSVLQIAVLACSFSIAASGIQIQSAAPAPAQGPNSRPDLVTVQKQNAGTFRINGAAGILADVKRLLEAGTDGEVVKAYIENWTGRYYVTADDILSLHQAGASSDVLTTLIKRSGELRAQAAQAAAVRPNAPAEAPGAATAPGTVYQVPPADSAYTYSQIYPQVASPYYSAPYYNYYYSYRNAYSPFGYSYWPYYYPPLYTYASFFYPRHRFYHPHYNHFRHWPSHAFYHGRFHRGHTPVFHHGRRGNWPVAHYGRPSGIHPWRPATSGHAWRSGPVHQFRGSTPGFRHAGFAGHSLGAPRMGFAGGGRPGMGFAGGGSPRMGFARGGGRR